MSRLKDARWAITVKGNVTEVEIDLPAKGKNPEARIYSRITIGNARAAKVPRRKPKGKRR